MGLLTFILALGLAAPTRAADPGFKMVKTWIPLKDTRLSATLYMPDPMPPITATSVKHPVLLEYLPYRKDDYLAMRNYDLHSYFAKRGFITAAVDIRGTGASEGVLVDREYSETEQLDGLEVLKWLASQPWSNGKVGMFGISWGGFNAIQLAMRRPPELKAILAVDASDELFHDDIHFIDGMMHLDEFSMSMDLQTAITPGLDFKLDQTSLENRFDQKPWTFLYLRHQRNGDFWKKVSLASNYSAIKIPVYLIGGLLDGYRDSIPRMLTQMKVPMKALIGPWNHVYPHLSGIGPAIEWRGDAVKWWNHWLRNQETGILKEPQVSIFLRESQRPSLKTATIPGKWMELKTWVDRKVRSQTFYLGAEHQLQNTESKSATHDLKYVPSAGLEAGLWWGELTVDQNPLDRQSLVYETAALKESMSILGQPRIKIWVSSTAPQTHWMVRLTDVAPDGTSALITGAGMNGAHRISSDAPVAIEPGKVFPLEFDLHLTTWVLPAGHRLRVAVSNSLWPMIFPSPELMTTSLFVGPKTPSQISIPLLPMDAAPRAVAYPTPEPYLTLPGSSSKGSTWPGEIKLTRNVAKKTARVNWSASDSTRYSWGTQTDREAMQFEVNDLAPEKASVSGQASTEIKLPGRTLTWAVDLELKSDAQNFYFQYQRKLLQGPKLIRQKLWKETIPRDHQ